MSLRKGFAVLAVVLCSVGIYVCAITVGSIFAEASELVTGLLSIF